MSDHVQIEEQTAAVRTGSRVRIRAGEAEQEWTVVAPYESDALRRRLSERSPLGSALLGHSAGDCVKVHAPEGRWDATIVEVD